jgi:hypothetical protein
VNITDKTGTITASSGRITDTVEYDAYYLMREPWPVVDVPLTLRDLSEKLDKILEILDGNRK